LLMAQPRSTSFGILDGFTHEGDPLLAFITSSSPSLQTMSWITTPDFSCFNGGEELSSSANTLPIGTNTTKETTIMIKEVIFIIYHELCSRIFLLLNIKILTPIDITKIVAIKDHKISDWPSSHILSKKEGTTSSCPISS